MKDAKEKQIVAAVEPPLFVFIKQYVTMVEGKKVRGFIWPILITSILAVVASAFLTMVPSLVMNSVVSAAGLTSTVAIHSLLVKRGVGPGEVQPRYIKYTLVGSFAVAMALFVFSKFIPAAIGGYLTIIIVLNSLVYWLVEDRKKNLAIIASRVEAERELARELAYEQQQDEEEYDDEYVEPDNDDGRWDDYIAEND